MADTDAQAPVPGADSPVDAPPAPTADEGTPTGPEAADGHDDGPGREAAKYRLRLREAEAERDALAGRLEAAQRREAERLAADLSQPGDLWLLGGVTLADLLTDDGEVDPAKVQAATAAVLDARPGLRRSKFPPVLLGRDPNPPLPAGPSWGDLLGG